MSNAPKSMAKRFLRAATTTAIVLAIGVGVYFYGWTALDFLVSSTFSPSSEIVEIERKIDLTEPGRRIFYATRPAIETGEDFNQHCQSNERTAAILGCYYLDRIYIYDVKSDELTGAKEVTAAHEMLHAAYARLNYFEKRNVNAMIERAYEKVKDDPEIAKAMEYYSQAEPGAELDELHSILGTTIAELDSDLENYYKKYFDNRAKIVSMNAEYNQVFAQVERRSEELRAKIESQAAAIKAESEVYQADLTRLNTEIATFNARANRSGGFASQAEFAAARQNLQARIESLNARRESLNSQIEIYNENVAELNSLAVRAKELYQSINGVSAPSGVN